MRSRRVQLLLLVVLTGVVLAAGGTRASGDLGLVSKFENDDVRVLELLLTPGQREEFHSHPRYVLYALTNYRVKNTAADGTSRVFERKAGDVFWGEAITHKGENVGTTDVHALIVELKR